jgi:hypothetical protein
MTVVRVQISPAFMSSSTPAENIGEKSFIDYGLQWWQETDADQGQRYRHKPIDHDPLDSTAVAYVANRSAAPALLVIKQREYIKHYPNHGCDFKGRRTSFHAV